MRKFKEFFQNMKIVEKAKIWLAVFVALIVAGAIVLGVVGLNTNHEFNGGVEVKVNYYLDLDETRNDIDNAARKVFKEEKLSVAESRKTEGDYYSLVYKFQIKEVPDGLEAKLKEALTDFNDQLVQDDETAKSVECETFAPSADFIPALWALLALGVATLISFIYLAIRYKWRRALSVVLSVVLSVFLTVSFLAFFRIPVGSAWIASVAFTYIFSGILSLFYIYRVREVIRSASYANASREEIANAGASKAFVRNLIISASVLVILIAGIIFAAMPIKLVLIECMIGVLVSLAVTTIAQTTFYAYIGKGGINKKNNYVPKPKKEKAEAAE